MSNINFENTTTPAISLMCKKHDYEYNVSTGTFVTGDWVISEKKQRELLGEKVTLTEFSQSEAYLGGRITGFIPSDKKSIALNVTIQSLQKSLNDKDLEKINNLIISTVESKTGAKIRS